MRRTVTHVAAAVLLALPALLAFGRGGYFAVARTRGALLACLLLAVAAAWARRPLPRSRAARAALGGLAGLTAWTGLSLLWAPLGGPAVADLERLVLYTATLAAGIALLAAERETAGVAPGERGPAGLAAPAPAGPGPAAHAPAGPGPGGLAAPAPARRGPCPVRWVEPALLATVIATAAYGLSERLVPWLVTLTRLPAAGDRLAQPLTYWNGQGALAALGLVLAAGIVADGSRPVALRSAAAATAPALGLDLYLTLSRGAIGACLAGLAIVVALVPSSLRAVAAVAGAALAAALTALVLTGVQAAGGSSGQGAAMLAVLALLGSGAGLAVRARPVSPPRVRPLALAALAAVLVATVVAAATGAREQTPVTGRPDRLVSVQSNRTAYWRVAAETFADHPLRGIGSGSFQVEWFKRRTFAEGVRDAHSLYIETAAELGLVGLLALAALLAGAVLAARDAVRAEGAAAAGAVAALAAFGLHAGLDWDWELPALSLVAILLVARLAAAAERLCIPGSFAPWANTPSETSPQGEASPPPGNPRFPLLDPLRAVAALAIVITHTAELGGFNTAHALGAWTARLDSGVAVFFVLSAFLLYRPFVAARLDGRAGPRLRRYARRRALRILPGYWAACISLGLLAPAQTPGIFGERWWVYFGLLQSWSKETIIQGVGVAWSLSVEAAFYVLLPIYALAMAWIVRRRGRDGQARLELALLAAGALLAVATRTAVHVIWPSSVFGNQFPGCWTWFTGGLALAVASAWLADRPVRDHPRLARLAAERPLWCWAAAFVLLTLAAWCVGLPRNPFSPTSTFSLQAQHVLYAGLAVCLVAPMVLHDGRRSLPAAILSRRSLAWLGLVSYGIFLYHQPLVFAFLNTRLWLPAMGWAFYTLLVIAGATAIAAASYSLVERPLLRYKEPQRTGGTGGASARARAQAVAAEPES